MAPWEERGLRVARLCGPHNADSTALALSFWEQILLGSLTQALWCKGAGGKGPRPDLSVCVSQPLSQPWPSQKHCWSSQARVAQLSCTISPHYAIVEDLGVS